MFKWLEKYFVFTRGEKRATVLLMAVILIALIAPRLYTLTQLAKQVDNSAYKEDAARFAQQLQQAQTAPAEATQTPEPDLTTHTAVVKNEVHESIELNTADTTALQNLPGIGSVLAKRIVSFRYLLGGFAEVEQLKEVYGLKPETFDAIKNKVTADPAQVKGVNLNRANAYGLKKHPYFKQHAESIAAARKQGGAFTSATDVKNRAGIEEAAFKKMKPYIEL